LRYRLATGTAFSFLAIVIGQLFALVTSILYARLLGPGNLGIFAIYTQFGAIAASFGTLGLSIPITRFVARLRMQPAEVLGRFLGTILVITVVASIVTSAVILLLAQEIGLGVYRSPDLVAMLQIASGFLVLDTFNIVGIAILQGLQKVRFLAIAGILIEAMTIPVMFVSLTVLGIVGAAIGGAGMTAIGSLLLFGSALRNLEKHGIRLRVSFDRSAARDLFRYAAPLLGSLIIVKLALFFQTSFLAVSLGYADTGLFRVASTVSNIIGFLPAAMNVPLLPAIAELYAVAPADRTRARMNTLLRMTSYVGAPLALSIAFGAAFIIELLYGPAYSGSGPLAFVLVMAGFVNVIDNVGTGSLLGEGRTGSLLLIDGLQAAIIVSGTVIFVGSFGLIGVGYANLLGSITYGILIIGFLSRTGRIDIKRVAWTFAPGLGGFGLAVIAYGWAAGHPGIWVGAPVVIFCAALAWVVMSPAERTLIVGALRDLWRHSTHEDR